MMTKCRYMWQLIMWQLWSTINILQEVFTSSSGSSSPLSIVTFLGIILFCVLYIYVFLILRIYQETEREFLFCVPHFSFTLKRVLCVFTPVLDNVVLKVAWKSADREHSNQCIKDGLEGVRSNAFQKVLWKQTYTIKRFNSSRHYPLIKKKNLI